MTAADAFERSACLAPRLPEGEAGSRVHPGCLWPGWVDEAELNVRQVLSLMAGDGSVDPDVYWRSMVPFVHPVCHPEPLLCPVGEVVRPASRLEPLLWQVGVACHRA